MPTPQLATTQKKRSRSKKSKSANRMPRGPAWRLAERKSRPILTAQPKPSAHPRTNAQAVSEASGRAQQAADAAEALKAAHKSEREALERERAGAEDLPPAEQAAAIRSVTLRERALKAKAALTQKTSQVAAAMLAKAEAYSTSLRRNV